MKQLQYNCHLPTNCSSCSMFLMKTMRWSLGWFLRLKATLFSHILAARACKSAHKSPYTSLSLSVHLCWRYQITPGERKVSSCHAMSPKLVITCNNHANLAMENLKLTDDFPIETPNNFSEFSIPSFGCDRNPGGRCMPWCRSRCTSLVLIVWDSWRHSLHRVHTERWQIHLQLQQGII